MEQINQYERNISLKTVGLTFVRRWTTILLFFIPIAAVSYIVTNHIMTKTYQSSVTLSRNAAVSAAQYQLVQSKVKESIPATVEALAEDNVWHPAIKHSNGSKITAAEITKGLSWTALASNSIYVTFSFQSSDVKIVQATLQELAEQSVETLKTDATTSKDFANVSISTQATVATKNSSEKKYFLIALAAGAVLSLGIAFLDEILSDEVYDAKDVASWGVPAFDMKAR